MNSSKKLHPEEGELMRYLDGELEEREVKAIRRHTESCWQCRRELNEIQATIDAYLRLRDAAVYPAPPRPWAALPLPVVAAERRVWRVWPVWRMAMAGGVVFAAALYLRPPSAPLLTPPSAATAVPTARVASAKVPERAAKPVSPVAEKGSLIALEVRVLEELHRVGADLGEAVEVSRNQDEVVVRLTALDAGRVAVIRRAVAGARVEVVRPKEGVVKEGVAVGGEATGATTTMIPRRPILGVGNDFANAVIDECDAITARVHALERMEARFRGTKLEESEARAVGRMEAAYRMGIREHAGRLGKLLESLEGEVIRVDRRPMAELSSYLDELVSSGFGGGPSELSDAELLGRLRGVLAELQR